MPVDYKYDPVSKLFARNDMDAIEHERLSNFTLKTQIKVIEQRLYSSSIFHTPFDLIYTIQRQHKA